MLRERFEEIVVQAVEGLPDEFKELLENVEIIVEDWPSREQLQEVGIKDRRNLFGLYEGIPRTARGQNYNLVLPDKISIFQRPLELHCRTTTELKREITHTVKHEIAHFFGLDDNTLYKIEQGYDT